MVFSRKPDPSDRLPTSSQIHGVAHGTAATGRKLFVFMNPCIVLSCTRSLCLVNTTIWMHCLEYDTINARGVTDHEGANHDVGLNGARAACESAGRVGIQQL